MSAPLTVQCVIFRVRKGKQVGRGAGLWFKKGRRHRDPPAPGSTMLHVVTFTFILRAWIRSPEM